MELFDNSYVISIGTRIIDMGDALSNTKVHLRNLKASEEIQKVAFSIGYRWKSNNSTNISQSGCKYIYFDINRTANKTHNRVVCTCGTTVMRFKYCIKMLNYLYKQTAKIDNIYLLQNWILSSCGLI